MGGSDGNWDGEDAIGAEVGDGDVGSVAQEGGGRGLPIGASHSDTVQAEGVWRGGGGLLPLNGTVAGLSPDTVGVVQFVEELTIAVALNIPGHSSEVLSTVCRGPKHMSI